MEILKTQAEEIAEQASEMQQCTKSDFKLDIDNRTWDSVCCELGNCKGPKCVFFRTCFYWQERKKWDKADIIVANHALLFTDLKLKSMQDAETSLLPEYGALIFDEAHTLENCAANHLGIKISKSGFIYQMNKLFNPKYSNGLLMRSGEMHTDVRHSADDVHKASEKFFAQVKERLTGLNIEEQRIRKPGEIKDTITISLNKLQHELRNLIKFEEDEDFKQELTSILQKISGYHSDFFDFLNMELEDFVYWIEKKGISENIHLNAAPIKVNTILQDMLFNSDFPVVLTSATLSVNNSMEYYRERVGYTNGPEIALGSPFNYKEQVKLYTARKMPLPKEDNYEKELIKHTKHFIKKTNGKAFVLFTSYYLLKKAVEELRVSLEEEGISIFVQGEGLSRTSMLNEFRKDINSVLFGTSSFWMGVDVPGESLSNVIITKLPFAVPSHPLIQARAEKVEEMGKSSFMHYSLPEAVLKFKQGIGRLIRSRNDKGIIVILDSRIVTKHYGKMFLNSIPQSPLVTYSDLSEIQ
jgi:ATP-dependent DNA helicase DinG